MNTISSSTSFAISGGPANLQDPGAQPQDAALDVSLVPMSALVGPELVFIESDVADAALLMQAMQAQGKEVYLLDPAQDGLALIASTLEGRGEISALHLVTHGGEGWIDLGATTLDAAAVAARQADLQAIGSHLSANGDILLYGCDVAAGAGASFVQALAAATGADVAASNDATGAASLGGDWELEIRSGDVEAQPAVDASLAELYGHILALSNVTATFGTGAGNNFTSVGGYSTASQDVAYKVSGDAAYELKIDATVDGAYAYANRVYVADNGTENLVTFSFTGGKIFTPSSMLVVNTAAYIPAQTLVFKGYDGGGGLVATQSLSLGAGVTPATINFTGFTNIATLKLTATSNSNLIKWLYMDNMVFTTIQSPDTTPPTLTGVTSSTTNGTYKVGDVIAVQVNFSEAVNVTGTPQLTLETGATDRVVNYSSGGGTSTLVFNYTVQAGDTSADLDYISTGALALNGGTIKDLAGNSLAATTLASPGAANSLGANKAIVIDGVVPTVSGVTSSTTNGAYKVGDVISIQVNFSEAVNVTGTPQLTLETGATDRVVNYASGTGSSALTFTYTVQAGDTTADLDYISTGALALNSGTIKDAAGNNATLTLASPGAANSLGSNKNIVIDTTVPTVSGVTSSTSNGAYKVGDVISIQVNFSEAVNVTGTPQLTLETGATDRVVNYASGTGSSALTFTYTVQAGDTAADLDYISTGALALNSGTIKDAAGNNATLTLASPGAANSLGSNKNIVIDTTVPTVSGVTSSTSNGAYKVGDVISIQVNFSEAVNVTGTPQLTLETGATDRVVNYASGTGSSALTFTYTVQAGDTAADLDYISTGALALNSGTIKDAAGNDATLTLASPGVANSLGSNKDIVIDTTVPTVSGVTSSTSNGAYKVGDVISIQVNFSEAVNVTGTPQLTLETGATDRVVNYASGTGSSALTFTYTVQAGDTAADLDYISTGALALNSGTIKDAAGNNATLTLASPGAANSLGANKDIVIDGVVPTVSGVTSSTINGTYKVGDVIAVQVNFSEAVNVTGTPQLTLETGTTDRVVNYASGTGSSTLVFNYTVQAGDTAADLDYISTGALALNSGTIKDAAGNNATLTLASPGAANSLGANKALVIDGVVPTVSGVTSSTTNGTYKVGDVIAVQVNFSELVNVTGTPQLTLETGTTDRTLNYTSGTGSSTLVFNYTVQAGDTTADLDYLSTSALTLNGGTIKDVTGNDATLTLASPGAANSLGANKALVIDGVVPTVSGVTSSTVNGTYKAGDVIAIQVNFSETVNVTGTPQLTLETGATDRTLNYASGTGSSTLVFNYTVQAGDTTADLDYISTSALVLNGGTIKDTAGNDATLTLASPGAANSLGANKALVIDAIAPTVSGVTSSATDGAYKVGDVLTIQVNFSESVAVTGTPQLTLETGATDRVLNYASGTGTSTLAFTYTVQAGDTSADLDYISTSALALNGGTIKDAAGNNATLTLASPGAANSLGATKNIVIDGVVPTVSGVTSSTTNGTYKVGDVISIQVGFSEAVNVTGTPQLTLETGATDRTLNYASGTGSNTLTFSYTVQAGDTTADLDYISTSALALNGGTIKDAAGNNATLTLASPGAANSLGANKAIVIDGVVPTVSGVTSSTTNGTYKIGDVIAVQVNFSETVNVTGTPQLTLETGATDRTLNYASGTGSSTLVFNYTVQAGDTTADLDYISTSALALNGGTIKDAAGNNATLTLASPGAANSLGANKALVIDGVVPTVSGVTSSTSNGAYKVGDVISIQVNFSEAVNVTGTPQLTLETGATDRVVNYASGTGSSALTFTYTVQAGDTTADLDYISTGALALNSGTIKDAAGNNATLTLASPGAANSLGSNKNIVIDTTVPTVSGVTSSTSNGAYKVGDVISIQVNFSEAVNVTGTPQLTLETGATDRVVNYASGTGSSALTFTYTVQAGDTAADLDYISTGALALNSGTIKDAAGNNATLTLASPGAATSLGANKDIVIDTTVPTVSGVTSSTTNGTYKVGDVIAVQVNFSEAVNVTGTPQLTLETGATDRTLNYASGTGSSTLVFNYTVQAGDTSADLDYISTSALALNGGTVKDAAGNNATLTLASPGAANSLGANKNIVIDTTNPTVSGVTSSTTNGTYKIGDVIAVQVNFSETVNVTGTPQLTLETGATDRTLNYASGTGSSTLVFNYTVQAGDTTADLDYISTSALALNGGTIKDAVGNNATLTLASPGAANSLGANKAIVIDGIVPTVSGVTSSTSNGPYKAGDVISIQVNFSEAVNVTGTPQLTLETGATDRVVNYASGTGTSTLTFTYTVQAGDTTADLDYLSTSALALNGGTVKDTAGNNATLTLASPGAANSLGSNKNIVIDTTAPTVSGVTSSTSNGGYKAGDVISVQVNFSEAVNVTGTPQLTLETGATDRVVNYASGTGTSTLTFTYTVQAGDTSADLDYLSTSALALNGGTVKDAAGNNATLTLANPGAANSLGSNKNIVIDTTPPAVSGVTSSATNGTYKIGDVIAVQVNFSETVNVTGTPQLTLETGATDRTLNYASGTGSSTLVFNYTVQAGDTTADLDYLSTSALTLNGGTIKDAVGNSATLTLASPGAANSLGANKNIVIDGIVPTVSGVTSSTANGTYKLGDVIAVQVNFSEAVNVTGTPHLTLETGATDRVLNYASGTGSSTLVFNYTVQAGDTSADLDYLSTGALALNGGTIKDLAGNTATLTLPSPGAANSLGANKAIVVDGIVPTVTGVTSSTADGLYQAGDVITIQVNFSETVNVTGTPQLTLETGTTDEVLNYVSGSGSTTLTFTYVVQEGDATADLDYLSTGALALNGGTIRDTAGNDATLALAAPGAANSLGANKAIVIDGVPPLVAGVSSSTADGLYKVGDVIVIQVNFSETVNVTGTPQLTLETGATDRVVNYSGGSGTSTLSFNYVVQPGDTTADLDYLSNAALALNDGTITDIAGNNATLTLPEPGTAGSLGANKNIALDTTAPVFSSAAVNGATLVLTYIEADALNAGAPPAASAFTIMASNKAIGVNSVVVDALAKTVTLTLGEAVASNQLVTINYTDPTPGDDANAIQDAAGNDAASLAAAAVTNNTPPPPPPDNTPGTGGPIVNSSHPGVLPERGDILVFDPLSIVDPDGGAKIGSITYQWLSNGAPINGATSAHYQVGLGDAGKQLSLTVNYLDGADHHEALFLTTTGRSGDGDGVPTAIELLVPALRAGGLVGDGNGDGLLDAYQVDVLSALVPNQPGQTGNHYITLVGDSNKGLIDGDPNHSVINSFTTGTVTGQAPAPLRMNTALTFNVDVGYNGLLETFSIFVDGSIGAKGFWLLGSNGHWHNVTTGIEQVGNMTRLDFFVADGGPFDSDGVANGVINFTGVVADPPNSIVGAPPIIILPGIGGTWLLF